MKAGVYEISVLGEDVEPNAALHTARSMAVPEL
jgi:hypothetical protein